MLLIWGEAALAGEKLGLYKPDMTFFKSFFFNWGIEENKKIKEKGDEGREGFKKVIVWCGGSCCRRKKEEGRDRGAAIKGGFRKKTKKG